ncbi:MarR family winged helix-turn-helix transcriptional regulator [Nocardia transvalensis]|uniref:MarR family winged helix-turn-helix transcriptional regulator n=1 Tax=Nocardia transvalensis TaxID=37333 RepID=UPI0018938B61|nr:MarR family winged helix-turn-helix transcriptional regulator [Nocardia transvalensis]MBF6333134.1 winged helix-turn-helix transcriptional regulator [Nocardia transvalensis]
MPSRPPAQDLPLLLLAAAAEVSDAVQAGVAAAGFTDVRPAHGFAFVRMAPDGATVGEIADHLGVTKQAASQLVEELVNKGYAQRNPHPHDARARLITLTDRGWAVTRAADAAQAEFTSRWAATLGAETLIGLRDALARVVTPSRVRPSAW